MDWLKNNPKIFERFEKYKFVILVIVIGIILMLVPVKGSQEPEHEPLTTESDVQLEEELAKILTQIKGVGKVQVMITEQTGSETVYQVDEDRSENDGHGSIKRETVILSGGGNQSGLIKTVTPPTYLGAIIVCQGASSPVVKLAVANAVSSVTGISLDRISVLEMK